MTILNDQNFAEEVRNYKGLAVVDFWAPWCGPCQSLGPIMEEIASEQSSKAKFGKFNVDEDLNIPTEFGIQSIPAVLFFKNGAVIQTLIGLQPKQAYIDTLATIG